MLVVLDLVSRPPTAPESRSSSSSPLLFFFLVVVVVAGLGSGVDVELEVLDESRELERFLRLLLRVRGLVDVVGFDSADSVAEKLSKSGETVHRIGEIEAK